MGETNRLLTEGTITSKVLVFDRRAGRGRN